MVNITDWEQHLNNIAAQNIAANRSRLADAYRRINEGADHYWVKQAVRCIHYLAKRNHSLAADDVWESMSHLEPPKNPSSMGLAFKIAQKADIIRSKQEWRKTRRKQAHGREIRVWESVINPEQGVAS